MASLDPPRFPPEIEIEIFRCAIQNNFRDVQNLILVAQRVHEWLMPNLFKVVVFTQPKMFPLRQFSVDVFQRYGRHVRHFCAAKDYNSPGSVDTEMASTINRYLELCPNLINLFMDWKMSISMILVIGHHPSITRLTTSTGHLFSILKQQWRASVINNPDPCTRIAFPHITHLRLTYLIPDLADVATLASNFPTLTHIAIPAGQTDQSGYEPQVRAILEACLALKLFVIWRGPGGLPGPGLVQERAEVATRWDSRVVELFSSVWRDWEAGANGTGLDVWEFAEEVIRKRQLDEGEKIRRGGGRRDC